MKCSLRCPHWYFNLTVPVGVGPLCRKYMLPLFDAWDKCFAVPGPGRGRRKKKPEERADGKAADGKPGEKTRSRPQSGGARPWPGSLRGWGPITMVLQGETDREGN